MLIHRRQFLAYSAGSLAAGSAVARAGMEAPKALSFSLKETAGLRRFGYPVHAVLPKHDRPGHDSGGATRYRLLCQGKEVPAQFRPCGPGRVVLDFTASPGPFEAADYSVEFGPLSTPGAEPRGGLSFARDKGMIRIESGGHLTYSIPGDLARLVSSVRSRDLEYFAPDSRGLFFIERGSQARAEVKFPPREDASGNPRWQGPLSVGLHFNGTLPLTGGRSLETAAALCFVSSKSWIETTWTIQDPEDRIGSMGFDLNLLVQGEPVLIDCGASSTVYSHLAREQTLAFEGTPSSPRWRIEQGTRSSLKPLAIASPSDRSAEGWVHVMDRQRCSAVAVADFARTGPDRFTMEGNGHVALERRFPPRAPASKTLRFWVHVVPAPVQVGAVTSPQAMLAPLVVEWGD